MRKTNKKTFSDLVAENKQALMRDREAIMQIEERLEQKHAMKLAE
ncbi:FbpB family small basic protein [Heyndrickxia acidiproducens]|nr:FbpB family small basic protein [Heyndrickxia acidiproducens]